ncbi:MAG: hypothetical protein IKF53_03520 [Clostridia bacterium]|nr:hypothetical protein [Clostridia bacterium]
MSGIKLSEYYDNRKNNYYSRSDSLRFLLIPFIYIVLLGLPGKYGNYIQTYCNFIAQTFYIMYGFFTLVPDKEKRLERLKRKLKDALKLFAIMFISHLVLSILYLWLTNSLGALFGSASVIKHSVFNFFVLNVWPLPVGNSIWFVQSLVYAYIFFIIAEKIGLSKFYVPLLIILSIFTLCTGEFAAFFGFPYRGYPFIPGGAVTRAIPYMLIGMLIRKNVDYLPKIKQFVYVIMFFVGLLLAVGEVELLKHIGKLVYLGHTIGFGVMAVSLCCFTLSKAKERKGFISNHGRNYSRRMYALCQPVALVCWIITLLVIPKYLLFIRVFSSIISFVISFIIVFIYGMLRVDGIKLFKKKKKIKDFTIE